MPARSYCLLGGLSALSLSAVDAARAQHPLEEVVVVGTPRSQSAVEIAQSVTILDERTLDRVAGMNLGETLESQLGVSATYFGAGASRPVIRGLAGARVRTMEDGIDSMDLATVSADHAVGIDPLVARQIEIFRGPTTLLYGSGAVGGVINTVTNRIPDFAPDDGFDAAFELRADSASDERTMVAALDGGGSALAWHVDGARRRTGDYAIPGLADLGSAGDPDAVPGRVENSDLELTSHSLGASWLRDTGFFGMAVSGFDSEYGVPAAHEHPAQAGDAAEPPTRIDLSQRRLDLKGGWLPSEGFLEGVNLRVGVNDYEHVELEGAVTGTRFTNDAWEGRLELLHAPWGAWTGAIGLQFGAREFSAIGEEAFVPPVDTASYGVFIVEQRETAHWDVSLGMRLESQMQKPGDGAPAVDDTATSFSLAGLRELGGGFSVALNFALAERLPAAEERYAFGPHLATGTIEIGDPGLTVETSRHLDVGLRRSMGDLVFDVTAFVTRYADFIYLSDSGVVDPVEELPVFYFTQADARLSGFEAELFSPVAKAGRGELDLRLFADRVAARLDAGERLPRIPPLRYGARLEYHDASATAGIEATRYDAQTDVAPFETPTAGYTMLNADVRWELPARGRTGFTIFARGTNLLDEDARRHASLVKDIAPLPGRSLSLGFRASF